MFKKLEVDTKNKTDSQFSDAPLITREHMCTSFDSGLTCACFDLHSMVDVMQFLSQTQLLRGLSVSASLLCTLSHLRRYSQLPCCEEAKDSHVERLFGNREIDPQPVPGALAPCCLSPSSRGPKNHGAE